MWIDENFVIDEVNANKFYNQLVVPQIVLNVGKYAILVVGVLIIIILEIVYFKTSQRNRDYQSLNNPRESNEINVEPDEATKLID